MRIDNLPLMPKLIDPLSGLENGLKIPGRKNQKVIVGHPRLYAKTVASPAQLNAQHPQIFYSTGSLNNPNIYQGELEISARTDAFAANNHFMGGLILEKTQGSTGPVQVGANGVGDWHIREMEFIPEARGFWDRGRFYSARGGVTKRNALAVILGDTHIGEEHQRIYMQILDGVVGELNPQYLILHDLFNGHSISHHERDKVITMAQKAEMGLLDLEWEFRQNAAFLNAILQKFPKLNIVIPHANHPFWLIRYLQSGQFMQEPKNSKLGVDLAKAMMDGENVMEYALRRFGLQKTNRVQFRDRGENFILGPDHRQAELGFHGDEGDSGRPGGIKSFKIGFDRGTYGHTHAFFRQNGVVNIPTTTDLILEYNKGGLSKWVQGLGALGPNGEIQTYLFTNSEFFSTPATEQRSPETFFEDGFPNLIPNREGTLVPDQYSQGRKLKKKVRDAR